MAGRNIQFGIYPLSTANGVRITKVDDLNAARRVLTAMDLAGQNGLSILRALLRGKVIKVDGYVLADSESQFSGYIREMLQALIAEHLNQSVPTADLQIETSVGTLVYDDCILLNTDTMFDPQDPSQPTWIPFHLLFLSPKGIAHEVNPTEVADDTITTSPYTNTVTISGDASPKPVLRFTFVDASTIDELTFTNQTTNESITISGLGLNDGDILVIDTELGEVRKNTTKIDFTGVFPRFLPGTNDYQIAFSGTSNVSQEQTSYDDVEVVYSAKWISQEFQVNGNQDISQLALFIRKVAGEVLALYDDFSGSISASKWNTSGSVTATGGRMRLNAIGQTSTATTDNKTPGGGVPDGDGINGVQFWFQWVGGGPEGTDRRFGITNGTDYIRLKSEHATQPGVSRWETGGAFSGGGGGETGPTGTVEIRVESGAVKVYWNGTYRFTAKASGGMPAGMYFWAQAPQISGETNYLEIDNLKFPTVATANVDLDVAIYPDDTGDPDIAGGAVTNGELSIAIGDIGTSFSQIIKAFATPPSLLDATVYHLVISQAGGDVNNYIEVRKNTAGGYADGTLETSGDSGTTWDDTTPAAEDLWFRLWTTLPTSFDVDLLISYFKSYFAAL